MLVENQLIEISWNNSTKQHYINKGYKYTNVGDIFFVKPTDLKTNSMEKVKIICDYCQKEKILPYKDYNKQTKNGAIKCACKDCGGKKNIEYNHNKEKYFNVFLEKCNENNCIAISTIDDYKNAHTKLQYICPKHGLQETTYDNIHSGSWCKLCGFDLTKKRLATPIDEVIKIIESKNNNKLLNPEDFVNSSTSNLRVICGCCNKEFTTSFRSIKDSNGACSKCGMRKGAISNKLSSIEVEKRINSINNNVLLNSEDYINNSTSNLKIRCGECGNIFKTSLANYEYNNKIRCDSCSQRISTPERSVMDFLSEYKINYIYNHTFDDCASKKLLPFDFYLPDYNLIIETDGEHHFRPVWGEQHHLRTQKHDKIKNDYCRCNSIKLIRIPFWQFANINEILKNELIEQQIDNRITYRIETA